MLGNNQNRTQAFPCFFGLYYILCGSSLQRRWQCNGSSSNIENHSQGILRSNAHFASGGDLGCLGRGIFVSLLRPPCFSPRSLHPEIGAPGAFLAVHGVHGRLGLFNCAEVDKQVVMVPGFEPLGRVRSEQLANVFTIASNQNNIRMPLSLSREQG